MFNRVIIASGPTIEPIDPVRYISNHSSGKMGAALAEAALNRGIEDIVFISGPAKYLPEGVEVISVLTAAEMRNRILEYFQQADVIIMAAAICDYRCEGIAAGKIKKESDSMTLKLIKNPDIIAELGRVKTAGQILVGFAAETDNSVVNAVLKRIKKGADLMVLNPISAETPVFDRDQSRIILIDEDGAKPMGIMDKRQSAEIIWNAIFSLADRNPA